MCRQDGADRHGKSVQSVTGVMRQGRLREYHSLDI